MQDEKTPLNLMAGPADSGFDAIMGPVMLGSADCVKVKVPAVLIGGGIGGANGAQTLVLQIQGMLPPWVLVNPLEPNPNPRVAACAVDLYVPRDSFRAKSVPKCDWYSVKFTITESEFEEYTADKSNKLLDFARLVLMNKHGHHTFHNRCYTFSEATRVAYECGQYGIVAYISGFIKGREDPVWKWKSFPDAFDSTQIDFQHPE